MLQERKPRGSERAEGEEEGKAVVTDAAEAQSQGVCCGPGARELRGASLGGGGAERVQQVSNRHGGGQGGG